jgi:hypothetical protein
MGVFLRPQKRPALGSIEPGDFSFETIKKRVKMGFFGRRWKTVKSAK